MDRSGSIPPTIKRKCSDILNDGGHTGKKARLQVIIPKLKLSEEQLQRLKKLTTKLQMALVNKECGIPTNITGVANTSTTEEVADLAPSTAQTARRKEAITEKESPVRHSLSDLLSGSSVSSHIETYPDCEEIDAERNVCEVPTGKSGLNPKSSKACLFYSDEPLPSENGGSPFLRDKDCIIIVPCYPDVVSETCQQVAEDFGKTLWNDNGQKAGLKTANTEQDESDCRKENQQLPFGNNKDSFSDDYKDEPESLSANHYQSTVEVVNSLLTSFAEEKEAKAQLEQLVSQLEEKNQELFSECEKLKKLVKDFQPTSTAKVETVSRGIQISMDLSLRRGRAVDRATSPVRIRSPSPDVTLLSYSIGCQASPEEVAPPKKVASSFCQTDPVVVPGLPPRSSTQNAVATRVQGIVMPSIQGRAPVQPLVSNPKPPNPFQVAYNSPISCQAGTGLNIPQVHFHPPPFTQGQRSSDLMSKQPYTTSLDTRYPVNIEQTSGSNTVDYQTSNNNAAGYHSRVPNAVHLNSNSTPPQLLGSHQYSSKSIYDKYAQQIATNPSSNVPGLVPQQVRLSHFTDQSFISLNHMLQYTNQRSPTFQNPFPGEQQRSNKAIAGNVFPNTTFPNTEIMTPNHQVTSARRNSVSINQTLNGNASSSSSPAQNIGTQQHSALRQRAPMYLSQLFRDSPSIVQTSGQRYNNEIRRLTTRQTSKECLQSSRLCEQPLSSPYGISKGSNVQIATSQHVEGVPSQHRRIEAYEGQTCTRLNNPPATESVPVMSNWTAEGKEQIEPNLSLSPASNSFNISQGTPVDGISDQRAQSHIQTSNPYGEVQVQRVYNESQGTSSNDKQPVSVVNEPNTSVTQLPNVSQQSQRMVSRSNHVVGMSEQRSVPHVPTTANTRPHGGTDRLESSQTWTDVTYSDRNLIGGTVEGTVLFSQEKVSGSVVRNLPSGETETPEENISSDNKTWKTTPNNQKNNPGKADLHLTDVDVGYGKEDLSSAINLRESASTQIGTSDQDDSTHKTSKDAFKVPSKTPGGALEETVQRLIVLQSRMANSENSSDEGFASADSNGELTDSVSKEGSGQEEKEKVEPQVVASEELDSNGEKATNSSEADKSFQVLYVNLMSPVIPRMTMPKRRRSISHERCMEDVGDGSSTSNVAGSSYVKGNSDQNSDFGALHELAGNEEGANESVRREQEKEITFRTDPTEEADSHELENGTLGGISKQGGDKDRDNTSSKDTVEEEEQATCSTKDHEMYTLMDSGSATSEPSRLSSSVSNNEGSVEKFDVTPNDTVEESQGTCSTKDQEINTSTDSVGVTAPQSKPSASVSITQAAVRTSATQNERLGLPKDTAKESEPFGRGTSMDLDNPKRGECNPMPQAKGFGEDQNTCAREGNVFKESVGTHGDTREPLSTSPLKEEISRNDCMSTSSRTDVKSDAEQCRLFVVNSKGPHKQDLAFLSEVSPPVEETLEQNKAVSNSLSKNGPNEKRAFPDSIKKSEETNLLPIPRVALRVENESTVELMWDLPSVSNVADVQYFEVCAIMVTQNAQGNQFGRWVKIGETKPMKLPMACKIRRLLSKTSSLHNFVVRAIGNNGQPGPYGSSAAFS